MVDLAGGVSVVPEMVRVIAAHGAGTRVYLRGTVAPDVEHELLHADAHGPFLEVDLPIADVMKALNPAT
ncbi:hypothetical protein ACOACO_17645 [Nocardioides sp. CPCC 205120]|uniref:hypothetical protein n=1 Tax=Nocardioides sp. CPCC 205120 TaxID=3406462 RepID=UPI003B500A94